MERMNTDFYTNIREAAEVHRQVGCEVATPEHLISCRGCQQHGSHQCASRVNV